MNKSNLVLFFLSSNNVFIDMFALSKHPRCFDISLCSLMLLRILIKMEITCVDLKHLYKMCITNKFTKADQKFKKELSTLLQQMICLCSVRFIVIQLQMENKIYAALCV